MINFLKSIFGKKEEEPKQEEKLESPQEKKSGPVKIPVIMQAEEEEGHGCGSGSGGCGSGGCGCGH